MIPQSAFDGLALIGLLLKSATVLGVAWGLARSASRASAAIRHGIWALAVFAVLMLPVAAPWLPSFRVPLPFELPSTSAAPQVAGTVAPAAESSWREAVRPGATTGTATIDPDPAGVPVAGARDEGGSLTWAAVLFSVWIAGVASRLVWLLVLSLRTRRLARIAARGARTEYALLAEDLSRELGIRRGVRALRTDAVEMPLAWGVLRPIILLPEAAVRWGEDRLRIVLLHELAHIRRYDYLTSILAEFACALYWPVPLVWIARDRLRVEQEQACDDLVLSTGAPPVEYAEHLLAIARAFYGRGADLGLAMSMAREVSLKHRVRAILDEHQDRRPLGSRRGFATAALLVAAFFPVAALAGARPESDESAISAAGGSRSETVTTGIWIEAEKGMHAGAVRTDEDLGASSAAFLRLDDISGGEDGSGVGYRFEVDSPGEYRMWVRLRGEDAPLAVSIDDNAPIVWDLDRLYGRDIASWRWLPVASPTASEGPEPLTAYLDGGTHSLNIRPMEPGVRIDRILITSDPEFIPAGRGPAAPGFRATYRLMEAERAELDGRVARRRYGSASDGRYIRFEDADSDRPDGSATFTIDVEQPGTYIVWGRVYAPDSRSNSLFVSVNGGDEMTWDAPSRELSRDEQGKWRWDPVSARARGGRVVDPVLFELPAGRNTVRIRTREDDILLDALLVTNDLTHRPRGLWPDSLPANPVDVWLEAESATFDPQFILGRDAEASGGGYLAVGEFGDDPMPPSESGLATFRVNLPEGGLYSLWASTIAPDADRDSFWVRVDDGDWIRWNDIPKRNRWTWSAVHDTDNAERLAQFQLDAGDHVIQLASRESGVRIDRLLLTNDPLANPGSTP